MLNQCNNSLLKKLATKAKERQAEESAFAGVDRMLDHQVKLKIAAVRAQFQVQLLDKMIVLLNARGIEARKDNFQEWGPRITRSPNQDETIVEYYLDYDVTFKGQSMRRLLLVTSEKVNVGYDEAGGLLKVTMGQDA